jgi:hypothetical protein
MTKEQEIIATNLFNRRKNGVNFLAQRAELIEEAIKFPMGTFENQKKTVVVTFDDNKDAYFLKPGKETVRKTPNIHDMYPNVAQNFDSWAFEQIWEYLIKISIIQQAAFKKTLVLLYRLCFYVDHNLIDDNRFRYNPSSLIVEYINNLDKFVLRDGFREKFKTSEVSLLEFLYFVDLLAWNEDVKYHSTGNTANFTDTNRRKVGRENTVMSIIGAPVLISKFIDNVIENTKPNGVIDVKLITTTIQKFTKTRGLCVLSVPQLADFLQPYLKK